MLNCKHTTCNNVMVVAFPCTHVVLLVSYEQINVAGKLSTEPAK